MKQKVIGVFVGSLRRESYSRKIANFVIGQTLDGISFKLVPIGDLPIYNQDFDDDGNPPVEYLKFREQLSTLDGFLFVTPEHNRTIPAVLKNALDVGSRPYGQNLWNNKPGGVISVSIGGIGGFGANHHLRQSMTFLNVLMLQQPEAYLGQVSDADFDGKGNLTKASTIKFVNAYIDAFVKWVDKLS